MVWGPRCEAVGLCCLTPRPPPVGTGQLWAALALGPAARPPGGGTCLGPRHQLLHSARFVLTSLTQLWRHLVAEHCGDSGDLRKINWIEPPPKSLQGRAEGPTFP